MPSLPPGVLVAGASAFTATAALLPRASPVLRARPRGVLVAVVVAAGAAAAALSGAEPTGYEAIDVAYRALVAVVATAAASRASRAAIGVATALAAAMAWPDPVIGSVAAIALGAWAAAVAMGRLTSVVSGAVGAVASIALLDGEWPERHGATAVVAAVAVAVLVASATRRSSTRVRRRVGAIIGALAAVVVAAVVLSAYVAWNASDEVRNATTAASRVARVARRGDTAALQEALRDARTSFDAARDWTTSPLAWPGRAVPVLAQHVALLDRAAGTGAHLAERLDGVATGAGLDELEVEGGGLDLTTVRRVGVALGDAREALAGAQQALADLDSPWLVGQVRRTLDRQRDRIGEATSEADTVARVLQLLPGFLGGEGPRRYFLAVQTPVESRAVGGLMGNYGELLAEDGRLRLGRFGRLRELNLGGTPAARSIPGPADYLARYARHRPETTWQNVNMSPDFPTVAEVIGHLYPQSGGAPIDGVVSVDPTALAAFLRLTGPVSVPSWPEPLRARNAERALYFGQYRRFDDDERVDFLGEVAVKVTERLTSMRITDVQRLVAVLGPAVRGGHLLVVTPDEHERALLDEVGLSGRLAPVSGDALAVVTQNAGGNKIDWFLRRAVEYRAVVDEATGSIRSEVVVTLRNEAPASGLPRSIIGNVVEPPLPAGTNRLLVSVYSPWTLERSSMPLERGVELGRNVYSAFVDVPPGGEVRLTLSLRGFVGDGEYRLDVRRQPAVSPDDITIDVRTAGGRRLARAAGALDADRSFGDATVEAAGK